MATRFWNNYAGGNWQFLILACLTSWCTPGCTGALFNVGPWNRSLCDPSTIAPPNRVNSTTQLGALRREMAAQNLSAYLVVMTDEHGSYSGSGYDARVAFMSGFTGSNGWAVVTQNEAAVWTDGRYFLQAEQQMDCSWTLNKQSVAGYPQSTAEWLRDLLEPGSVLGGFPNIVTQSIWQTHSYSYGIEAVTKDLVDLVWTTGRPPKQNNRLIVHSIDFAGETWSSKLKRTRQKMSENGVDILVVTVLEQVAWLFNLRGTDRTSSLFYGYAIIYDKKSSLFVLNATVLLDLNVREHLNVSQTGFCNNDSSVDCINVYEYNDVYEHIRAIPKEKLIWIDSSANQAVYGAAKDGNGNHLYTAASPIELMKSIKNDVERRRFAECILRDSAAVVEFAAFMESEILAERKWTEITAAEKVNSIRANYTNNKGLSFNTISAFGSNAAIIHYRPDRDTVASINKSNVYLLDSGGQYLDGTTDVTRTFHYGTPSDTVKEAYTRVLMGQIDMAQSVWNDFAYGADIDMRARFPLFQHGWDYNHGTGHGIGYFLSVHEGPGRINKGYGGSEYLQEGMFFSDEPGYYEDGRFGIRLENLVTVVEANTPNRFAGKKYLTFKTLTLVPYEPKLIKYELLSRAQETWLAEYNKQCLEQVGDYVRKVRNNTKAYDWIVKRTATRTGTGTGTAPAASFVMIACLAALLAVAM